MTSWMNDVLKMFEGCSGYPLRFDAEKGTEFYVDFPGTPKENITMEIKNSGLFIKEKEGKQISLPNLSENLDLENLSAEYKDGRLRVKIPPKEKIKPKLIKIN